MRRSPEPEDVGSNPTGPVTRTRYLLGKGVARRVRHRLNALSAAVPPSVPAVGVAAVRSVHRTAAAPAER